MMDVDDENMIRTMRITDMQFDMFEANRLLTAACEVGIDTLQLQKTYFQPPFGSMFGCLLAYHTIKRLDIMWEEQEHDDYYGKLIECALACSTTISVLRIEGRCAGEHNNDRLHNENNWREASEERKAMYCMKQGFYGHLYAGLSDAPTSAAPLTNLIIEYTPIRSMSDVYNLCNAMSSARCRESLNKVILKGCSLQGSDIVKIITELKILPLLYYVDLSINDVLTVDQLKDVASAIGLAFPLIKSFLMANYNYPPTPRGTSARETWDYSTSDEDKAAIIEGNNTVKTAFVEAIKARGNNFTLQQLFLSRHHFDPLIAFDLMLNRFGRSFWTIGQSNKVPHGLWPHVLNMPHNWSRRGRSIDYDPPNAVWRCAFDSFGLDHDCVTLLDNEDATIEECEASIIYSILRAQPTLIKDVRI
jgi:hypothetical protein